MKNTELLRILSVVGHKSDIDSQNNEARKNQIKKLENAINEIRDVDCLSYEDEVWPSHLEALIITGEYKLAEQFIEKIFSLIYSKRHRGENRNANAETFSQQEVNRIVQVCQHIFCIGAGSNYTPTSIEWVGKLRAKLPLFKNISAKPFPELIAEDVSIFLSPLIMTSCIAIANDEQSTEIKSRTGKVCEDKIEADEDRQAWKLVSTLFEKYEQTLDEPGFSRDDRCKELVYDQLHTLLNLLVYFAEEKPDVIELFSRLIKLWRTKVHRAYNFEYNHKNYPYIFRRLTDLAEPTSQKTLRGFGQKYLKKSSREAGPKKLYLDLEAVLLLVGKARMYSAYQDAMKEKENIVSEQKNGNRYLTSYDKLANFNSTVLMTEEIAQKIMQADLEKKELSEALSKYNEIKAKFDAKCPKIFTLNIVVFNRVELGFYKEVISTLTNYVYRNFQKNISTGHHQILKLEDLKKKNDKLEQLTTNLEDLNIYLSWLKGIISEHVLCQFFPDYFREKIMNGPLDEIDIALENMCLKENGISFNEKILCIDNLRYAHQIQKLLTTLREKFEKYESTTIKLGNSTIKAMISRFTDSLLQESNEPWMPTKFDWLSTTTKERIKKDKTKLQGLARTAPDSDHYKAACKKMAIQFVIIAFFTENQKIMSQKASDYIDSMFKYIEEKDTKSTNELLDKIIKLHKGTVIGINLPSPYSDIKQLLSLENVRTKRDKAVEKFLEKINEHTIGCVLQSTYADANEWVNHYREVHQHRYDLIENLSKIFSDESSAAAVRIYNFFIIINDKENEILKEHLQQLFAKINEISYTEYSENIKAFFQQLITEFTNSDAFWLYETNKNLKRQDFANSSLFLNETANVGTDRDSNRMKLMKLFFDLYNSYYQQVTQSKHFILQKQESLQNEGNWDTGHDIARLKEDHNKKMVFLVLFRKNALELSTELKNTHTYPEEIFSELIQNLTSRLKRAEILPSSVSMQSVIVRDFTRSIFKEIQEEIKKIQNNLTELNKVKSDQLYLDQKFDELQLSLWEITKKNTYSGKESKRDDSLHDYSCLDNLLTQMQNLIGTKRHLRTKALDLKLKSFIDNKSFYKKSLEEFKSVIKKIKELLNTYHEVESSINKIIENFRDMGAISSCLALHSDDDISDFCYATIDLGEALESERSLELYTTSVIQSYNSIDNEITVRDYHGVNQAKIIYNNIINEIFQDWFTTQFTNRKTGPRSHNDTELLKKQISRLKEIKHFIGDLLPIENCVFEKIVAFHGEHESPEELIKEFVFKFLNNAMPRKIPHIKNQLSKQFIAAVSAYLNQPRRLHFCCFYQALEFEPQVCNWLRKLNGEVVTPSHTIEPS